MHCYCSELLLIGLSFFSICLTFSNTLKIESFRNGYWRYRTLYGHFHFMTFHFSCIRFVFGRHSASGFAWVPPVHTRINADLILTPLAIAIANAHATVIVTSSSIERREINADKSFSIHGGVTFPNELSRSSSEKIQFSLVASNLMRQHLSTTFRCRFGESTARAHFQILIFCSAQYKAIFISNVQRYNQTAHCIKNRSTHGFPSFVRHNQNTFGDNKKRDKDVKSISVLARTAERQRE